jgi:ATP-binding cassette subfamily B protein
MKTWQFMLHLVRYRPWFYLLNLGSIIMVLLLEQVPGLAGRAYFDLLSGEAAASGLGVIIAALLFAELGRVVFSYGCGLTNLPFMFSLAALMRKNLFAHMLNAPGARAVPTSPGEAISRFRDDVDELPGTMMWLNDMIAFGIFALISIVIMLRINMVLTLAVFLPLIVVVAAGNFVGARVEANRRASRESTGGITGYLGEIFGAVQAVQVAGAEVEVIDYFRTLNETRRSSSVKDRLFTEVLSAMSANAVNLGTGLILMLAAAEIRAGTFTVGDLSLFVFYLNFIAEFTGLAGALIAHYKQMGVSFSRLLALQPNAPPSTLVAHGPVYLDGSVPVISPLPKTDADRLEVLEAHGLSYHYPESGRGISRVDLRLARGSFTVITGRIGSGKTTLLRALLGLVPTDAGSVVWNGRRVDDPAQFMTPPRCAYTSQVPRLFSETLRDNILLGFSAPNGALDAALHTTVLQPDVAEMSTGLDTLVGPRGLRLSAGRFSARRRPACSCVIPNCSCVTICPARSTLKLSAPCRSGCLRGTAGRWIRCPPTIVPILTPLRAWSSRTAVPCCAAPITSSFLRTAPSRRRARSMSCSQPAWRCSACGTASSRAHSVRRSRPPRARRPARRAD